MRIHLGGLKTIPKFTKQHYELIASAISETRTHFSTIADPQYNVIESTLTHLENYLTRIFIDDNPRFSLSRFEKACELKSE